MRDFFYNKGDVLIAVLIILVAAFVIYLRVGVIMDYSASGGSLLPNPLAALGSAADKDDDDADDVDDSADQDSVGDAALGVPPAEPADGGAEPAEPAADEPAEIPPEDLQMDEPEPEPPPPPQEVQITVSAGDNGGIIADKLIAAGLITDKQGWISDLVASGADRNVKQGTFTIPTGSSHSEIIEILTR